METTIADRPNPDDITGMIRDMTTIVAAACLACAQSGCKPGDQTVTQPQALNNANPVHYPVALWDNHTEGETILLLHVTDKGDVDSTRIERGSGHAEFDSAATNGARKMKFTPGRRGEKYVSMWTRMPIRFSIDSTATIGVPVAPDTLND